MTSGGSWLIAIGLAWLIAEVLFGKKRAKWYPFGGMFKRDRKTGAITMALTLPTKKSVRRRRK